MLGYARRPVAREWVQNRAGPARIKHWALASAGCTHVRAHHCVVLTCPYLLTTLHATPMHPLLQVDRVHVGGSLGRRTSVQRRFDVDLLVFVNGLDTSNKARIQGLLTFVSCHTLAVLGCGC